MPVKPASAKRTPEAELRSYILRFGPKDQKLIRSVRAAVRRRFPAANELAYDYGTFFVIAYSPTEQPLDSIVSVAARPDGVRLYLMQGPKLPDPKKLLMGSGKLTRFIRVGAASELAHPDVKALIAAAIDKAPVRVPSRGKGKLLIRTAASKQRPGRKPTR